jgi:hypothetical protein
VVEALVVIDDELIDLQRRADDFELLYLRAREGAQAANRGLQRLRAGYARTKLDLQVAEARIERLQRDKNELEKKVERLSLRIIGEWGRK